MKMADQKKKTLKTLAFKRPDKEGLLLEIIDLSHLDRPIADYYHRHDFYELILILEGTTAHKVDFVDYVIKRNEILIIPKNSIHKGDFNEKIKGFIILFTADFFSPEQFEYILALKPFNIASSSNKITIAPESLGEVLQIFHSLNNEYAKHRVLLDYNILRFLILALITKLNNYFNEANRPFLVHSTICSTFFELLEQYYTKEHSVSFYCNRLNCTPRKLSQLLLDSAGKTALNLILGRIMLEAKRELTFTNKSIKEIAFYLGYADQLYFSKAFKKSIGVTPQQFRKDYTTIRNALT